MSIPYYGIAIPAWKKRIITDFFSKINRLSRTLSLSIRGLRSVEHAPTMIRALHETEHYAEVPTPEATRARELAAAEDDAAFARSEALADFPILHEQALFSLWGLLEEFVKTYVAKCITKEPEHIRSDFFAEKKVKIGEILFIDDDARAEFLVDLIERDTGASLKVGIGRFESLLAPIGMNGALDEAVRRSLMEMSQIRNCVAHRGGVADKKLTDSCPSLGFAMGHRINVTSTMWRNYQDAAAAYALEILQRVRLMHGLPRYTAEKSDQDFD